MEATVRIIFKLFHFVSNIDRCRVIKSLEESAALNLSKALFNGMFPKIVTANAPTIYKIDAISNNQKFEMIGLPYFKQVQQVIKLRLQRNL